MPTVKHRARAPTWGLLSIFSKNPHVPSHTEHEPHQDPTRAPAHLATDHSASAGPRGLRGYEPSDGQRPGAGDPAAPHGCTLARHIAPAGGKGQHTFPGWTRKGDGVSNVWSSSWGGRRREGLEPSTGRPPARPPESKAICAQEQQSDTSGGQEELKA